MNAVRALILDHGEVRSHPGLQAVHFASDDALDCLRAAIAAG